MNASTRPLKHAHAQVGVAWNAWYRRRQYLAVLATAPVTFTVWRVARIGPLGGGGCVGKGKRAWAPYSVQVWGNNNGWQGWNCVVEQCFCFFKWGDSAGPATRLRLAQGYRLEGQQVYMHVTRPSFCECVRSSNLLRCGRVVDEAGENWSGQILLLMEARRHADALAQPPWQLSGVVLSTMFCSLIAPYNLSLTNLSMQPIHDWVLAPLTTRSKVELVRIRVVRSTGFSLGWGLQNKAREKSRPQYIHGVATAMFTQHQPRIAHNWPSSCS